MIDPTGSRAPSDADPATNTAAHERAGKPRALKLPVIPDLSRGQTVYTTIVALIAWSLAVYDSITFGNLLPFIQKSFDWSTATASYIATLVSAAALVFALVVGPLIDLFGRRLALFVTTAGAALSSGLAALAIGPISLIMFRSLSGFGQSEQAVNAAYLNEVFTARRRGFLYGVVQAGWPIGVMLSSLAAVVLEPRIGWRGVFLVATAPLLIILVFRIWLKESPFFLKMQYIRKLRDSGAEEGARAAAEQWGLEAATARRKNTYAELFAPGLRKQTISVAMMFFLKLIGDSQMTILATTVLSHGKGINLSSALWTVLVGNAVAFVGYLVMGYAGDRIGRRETVIVCEILAALATAYLLIAAHGLVEIVVFYSLELFFAQGAAAPLFAYIGESYPTRVRGSGAALINVAGPVGGIVGPLLYATLQSAGLSAATAGISGAVAAVLAAGCLLGARRIRPGQDLVAVAH